MKLWKGKFLITLLVVLIVTSMRGISSSEVLQNVPEGLKLNDFTVWSEQEKITLATPAKNINIKEKELSSNFVGEKIVDNNIYKYYEHNYEDFYIIISNAYYNTRNSTFDDYYLFQITLQTSKYKTSRGITVGSTLNDLLMAYGKGEETVRSGNTVIFYQYKDWGIEFVLTPQNKVEEISLFVCDTEAS